MHAYVCVGRSIWLVYERTLCTMYLHLSAVPTIWGKFNAIATPNPLAGVSEENKRVHIKFLTTLDLLSQYLRKTHIANSYRGDPAAQLVALNNFPIGYKVRAL